MIFNIYNQCTKVQYLLEIVAALFHKIAIGVYEIKTSHGYYTVRGGKFVFAFGDIHLTIIYLKSLNMLGVKMPAHEVFVSVDYSLNLGDNLNVLMNKLLVRYPQLAD